MSFYNLAVIIVDHNNVTRSWNLTAINTFEADMLIGEIRSAIERVSTITDIGNAHHGTPAVIDEAGGF